MLERSGRVTHKPINLSIVTDKMQPVAIGGERIKRLFESKTLVGSR